MIRVTDFHPFLTEDSTPADSTVMTKQQKSSLEKLRDAQQAESSK